MVTAIIVFHVFVCVLLTIVVLLQFGKGAEVGAVMGSGASQSIISSSSKGNFFSKLTTVLAILFFINSIVLTTIKSQDARESILDDKVDPVAAPLNSDQNQPATETAPAAPESAQ
jgi:preprotein translocase subunit SecG